MARAYKPGGIGIYFDGLNRPVENATTTCAHCQHISDVPDGQRAEDSVVRLCRVCMGLICPACVRLGICKPVEKWCEEQERLGRYNKVEFDKAFVRHEQTERKA